MRCTYPTMLARSLTGYPHSADRSGRCETAAVASVSVERWLPVGVSIAILAISNVASNRAFTGWGYVPWNVLVAVVLVVVARRLDNVRRIDLGLANIRRGLKIGLALVLTVAAVYAVAVAFPSTRDLFRDKRVGGRSALAMVTETLVRIPLGTVMLEEVAFRGVLLGQFGRRLGWRRGTLASSALFGLWHVLPSLGINRVNPTLRDAGIARPVAVVGAVLLTGLAGCFMCFVRLRARSLLAPAFLHVATNSLGFATAWFVLRR
jgi:uncharacterized protein